MRVARVRRVVAVAVPCLLAGCSVPGHGLVGPAPQRPTLAVVEGMEAQSGRVPLVTIAASAGPEQYQSALAGAVQAAEARKPDVVFDVLSAVPQTGTPVRQIDAAKALTPDASEVASAILGDGVPADRITLGAVVVPGIAENQVRVYVR